MKISNSQHRTWRPKTLLGLLGRKPFRACFYNFMTLFIPGKNHFDVIPNGWVVVEHISGMPIYLHRQSRSISVTRPYHLGPASARVSTKDCLPKFPFYDKILAMFLPIVCKYFTKLRIWQSFWDWKLMEE